MAACPPLLSQVMKVDWVGGYATAKETECPHLLLTTGEAPTEDPLLLSVGLACPFVLWSWEDSNLRLATPLSEAGKPNRDRECAEKVIAYISSEMCFSAKISTFAAVTAVVTLVMAMTLVSGNC